MEEVVGQPSQGVSAVMQGWEQVISTCYSGANNVLQSFPLRRSSSNRILLQMGCAQLCRAAVPHCCGALGQPMVLLFSSQ